MRVAREVSIEKFDQEVAILRQQETPLRALGCHLVRISFPEIDVLIVPIRKLAMAVPLVPDCYTPGRPNQLNVLGHVNAFTAMAFGVRFVLDDFDLRAPSVTFRHPTTWDLLPHGHLPRGVHMINGKPPGMQVVHDKHPTTGLPFFCMRGTREYHEHPQHSGDEWLLYRGSINTFAILSSIIRCCCTNVGPAIVLVPQAPDVEFALAVEWLL